MTRRVSVHRRLPARGPIDANAVYPVAVFIRRLGIGRHSLNALRRQGLPVRPIGRRLFIDGAEALACLRRLWAAENQSHDPPPESAVSGGNGTLGSTKATATAPAPGAGQGGPRQ